MAQASNPHNLTPQQQALKEMIDKADGLSDLLVIVNSARDYGVIDTEDYARLYRYLSTNVMMSLRDCKITLRNAVLPKEAR